MRVKYIFKNFYTGAMNTFISTLLSFLLRTLFIYKLGNTYLGVNGLLSNVLSMLSLAELGIGNAIGFSLYKPIAEKNHEKIKSLMDYYKKAYAIIGTFVLVIGLALIPVLPLIIKDINSIDNIYLIYLLYLVNSAYTYFFSYKRTLIQSDQQSYKLTQRLLVYKTLTTFSQGAYLLIGSNFIIYLLIRLGMGVVENVGINFFLDKEYPYLREKNIKTLDKKEKNKITTNVKGMVFHKIGDYLINGTDNIIMSRFINIAIVGIYSNYSMIIYNVHCFLVIIFYSASASFGNLISTEKKEVVYSKFKTFNFLAFWIFGFASLAFYFLLNPFIKIWIGDEYLIGTVTIFVVVLNYFFTSMRVPIDVIKSGAGIFKQDRFVPLIEATVNIVFSIIFVNIYGLTGVFLGTLASSVLVAFWAKPYFSYKYVFDIPLLYYFKIFIKYFITIAFEGMILAVIFKYIIFGNIYIDFIFKVFIIVLVPNLINCIIYKNSFEFNELINIVKNLFKKNKTANES